MYNCISGPLSLVYTLTVSLTDENDISPICTSSYYSVSIKEDILLGTSIAQLDCTDRDAETPNNEITTYVITSGNEGLNQSYFIYFVVNTMNVGRHGF